MSSAAKSAARETFANERNARNAVFGNGCWKTPRANRNRPTPAVVFHAARPHAGLAAYLPTTHSFLSLCQGRRVVPFCWAFTPQRLSGGDHGCRAACLNTAGNPAFAAGKERARLARTQLYFADRTAYAALLVDELALWQERAAAQGYRLAVRLNGTSDIAWERVIPQLFATFPHEQFYDYTKLLRRLGRTPANYDLTLSRSETNHSECLAWLREGAAVRLFSRPGVASRCRRSTRGFRWTMAIRTICCSCVRCARGSDCGPRVGRGAIKAGSSFVSPHVIRHALSCCLVEQGRAL